MGQKIQVVQLRPELLRTEQAQEETELVIAQRLLACILARRLDDIHLLPDSEIECLKTNNQKEECPGL